jgi:archaemetzincin
MGPAPSSCDHASLCVDPSSHAQHVGYSRRTAQQLVAATRASGRAPKAEKAGDSVPEASTFPAPLVLPGDDLSWDPKYGAQSLKSWRQESDRNPVTDERKTVYVVPVPSVAAEVKHVKGWTQPKLPSQASTAVRPYHNEVVQYLAAFYHSLPVRLLFQPKLQFMAWDDGRPAKKKRSKVSYVALFIGSEAVRIRARPSSDGLFGGQLNLEDILDAAIAMLPADAYALLLLMDHDLYEEEDNDFCCGRAYGGSRVAVVSSARYNPALDAKQEVEVEHSWPASHCQAYVDSCVRNADDGAAPPKKKARVTTKQQQAEAASPQPSSSAIQAAVRAFSAVSASSRSDSALWLARFCRTASHELGHCFGMDHCVYYACSMQGSAGLSEDARQPPYLCPVDLAKILRAAGAGPTKRYRALLAFCERFERQERTFAAFAAWLRQRIATIAES